MRNILIPMDFTELSVNAFNYAMDRYPNDKLHAIHVVKSIPSKDSQYLKEGHTKSSILLNELEKSICLSLNIKSLPDNVNVEVIVGDFPKVIKNFVLDNDVKFVLMGTRDKHDLIDRWIGTNSLALVKLLDVPVYLIPRYGKLRSLEKVLIASDHHLLDPKVISFIREWNTSNSFLKFLHIKTSIDDDFEKEKNVIISELFKDGEPEFGFEISSVESKNITDSLLASAYNFGADLLVVFPENQNFMQSLVFRSVSKELIQKSNIPLLFVH